MQLYKIYRSGNYISIEWTDVAGKAYKKRHSCSRLTYEKGDKTFNLFQDLKGLQYNPEFEAGLKENGSPYTELELELFFNENTAYVAGAPGGGGAGDASAANQTVSNAKLTNIDTKTPPLVGGKVPVVISSLPIAIGASTEAKQDAGIIAINTLLKPADTLAKVSVIDTITNPVTINATTLPLPTGGSTSALQNIGNTSLNSIDTKLTDVATATNQANQKTVLDNILLELKDDINASETVWYDKVTPTLFYVRRSSTNQDTGGVTVSFYDVAGVLATPTIANLVQVISGTDYEFNTIQRKAITAGVGYSENDRIQELQIINMSLAVLVNTIWVNKTTDTIIATPIFSHLIIDDSYSNSANQVLEITELQLIKANQTNNTQSTKILDSNGANIVKGSSTMTNSLPFTLASDDAQIGVDNTGITQINTGTGIRGWLSGIYKRLTDALTNTSSPFTKLTDGVNNATIKAASTAPALSDTALVVSLSGNSAGMGSIAPSSVPTRMGVVGGVYNSTSPTFTNGQTGALQTDVNGKLQTVSNLGATIYVQSTGNNTAVQLAAGATFTGTIESALSYPQAIISIRANQNITINIDQFSDAAGTIQYPTLTYTRLANAGFNQAVNLAGSYYRLRITNNGGATTTTLFAETWLGILPPLPQLNNDGNFPVVAVNQGTSNSGLYSIFRNEALLATVITVKATVGNVYGVNIINTNVVPVYLKFFDAATVTLGTTSPTEVLAIPASGALLIEPKNVVFSYFQTNSIKIAAVTGVLTASTAAPSTGLVVEVKYI